jgi:hypothetical protein
MTVDAQEDSPLCQAAQWDRALPALTAAGVYSQARGQPVRKRARTRRRREERKKDSFCLRGAVWVPVGPAGGYVSPYKGHTAMPLAPGLLGIYPRIGAPEERAAIRPPTFPPQ